jgi:cell shape-determining protein MreC
MKTLTREQVEKRKAQAVRFTETVLHDSDRADEIAEESVEDYAERKRIQIQNPRRMSYMASKRELEERVQELEEENDDLNDRLDQVADLVGVEEEEEEVEEPVPNRRR